MIITITGVSGSGKSAIARKLIDDRPSDCRMLLSYTTRPARKGEIPGEYAYLSEEEFEQMRAAGKFEWTAPPMRGRNYGTAHATLDEAAANPRAVWISILVPERVATLHEAMTRRNAADHIRSFFICSPGDDVIIRRLVDLRGFSHEQAVNDLARYQDCESQVRATGLPVTYIKDNDDLEEKYRLVLEKLS